ncbi:MAG: YwaF family protein [Clostridia bacterium]|nr:YwaF family protein [Clostridia bacterium]
MKEFLGIGGYQRQPEGALSWQHLTFVGLLMAAMIVLAVVLGKRNRNRDEKTKNRVLIAAAILIDAIEIFKLVVFCARGSGLAEMRHNLPLFLCSIQLIVIPLAAFSRGRVREAALDFVFVFGLLGGVLGTVGAFQNYNAYPVLGIENVASGLTHSIAGFASLYVGISGMAGMERRNVPITYGILLFFIAAAFIANAALDYNYMFLRRGDGTPYDVLYNLVHGSPVLYPIGVVALFLVYIAVFYLIVGLVRRKRRAAGAQRS